MSFRTEEGKCARCGKEKFNPETWHCLECGNWRRPKKILPKSSVTEPLSNREFWKKRTMTYLGSKIYFDQDIKSGVCFFCKKEGRAQRSKITILHHARYFHQDPLAWTIEVCTKCHWQIDDYNKKMVDRSYGREGPSFWQKRRFGH